MAFALVQSPPLVKSSTLEIHQLLTNTLVLYQITPYLPPSSLLALGATSKSIRSIIYGTPGAFRHLDLTSVKSARFELAAIDNGGEIWRNQQMDENVTEDDFYGGPLRGIFNRLRRQQLLQHVQTLVLDGLSVTSDLVCEIILQDVFNVRVLSIREVHNLNERKLRQALEYAVRPTRADNTPKLQALYIFGPRDRAVSGSRRTNKKSEHIQIIAAVPFGGSIMHGQGAQIGAEWNQKSDDWLADSMQDDKWYQRSGKVLSKSISIEWENTMRACEGIISFDAVLCRGPRHSDSVTSVNDGILPWYKKQDAWLNTRMANFSVGGCHGCGSSPEGFAVFGKSSLNHFPLLAPPHFHSSTQRADKIPFSGTADQNFLARCDHCLRARYCQSCHKWWCENCYEIPDIASSTKSLLTSSDGHSFKVHMDLCVENCLPNTMMAGAGSNGMWG